MIVKNPQGNYQLSKFIRPDLIHGISSKQIGDMSYVLGEKDKVTQNRRKFTVLSGLNDKKTGQFVAGHGTQIETIKSENLGSLYNLDKALTNTDGMITNLKNVALLVLTGDCLPIVFYDPVKKVIAAVHSGWMGTVGKISTKAVAKMTGEFGCKVTNINVGIGPSIEKCHYFEPPPIVQQGLPEWKDFYKESGNRFQIDLSGFVINELQQIGILKKNIDHANYCTEEHSDEFFCSQEETAGIARPGRFATVIQMI